MKRRSNCTAMARAPRPQKVRFTADVASLRAQFATAQASVRALASEMKSLAKQSAAGVLDPNGLAQLEDVSRQVVTLREYTPAEVAAMTPAELEACQQEAAQQYIQMLRHGALDPDMAEKFEELATQQHEPRRTRGKR